MQPGDGDLMYKNLSASVRKRALSFGLAVSALIGLAAAPAVARQCPRGEYLRVSKGICVAKADARKHLGTSHGAAGKGDIANPDGMVLMHSEASTAYAPVKTPSSGALEAVDNPKGSKASAANVSQSPYGELSIESFAKH
jgi:hypothetical protein